MFLFSFSSSFLSIIYCLLATSYLNYSIFIAFYL